MLKKLIHYFRTLRYGRYCEDAGGDCYFCMKQSKCPLSEFKN